MILLAALAQALRLASRTLTSQPHSLEGHCRRIRHRSPVAAGVMVIVCQMPQGSLRASSIGPSQSVASPESHARIAILQ